MARIGRNQPCPCGSGKKYKQCCGRAPDKLPDPQSMRATMGRQMQAISKLLEGQEFESAEEANDFLQNLVAQGGIPFTPDTPQEQAQELVYQAWEAGSRQQRQRLAREALEIYPDCADAYVVLAENAARGPEEARELYQKGIEAGVRSLGLEVFEEEAGYFWGIIETRPYMRARQGLAQVLWALGDLDGAAEHYWDMLRLNPNDNQGVRYELLECLLGLEDMERVEELLAQYDEEFSANWLFTRALVSFLREGDTPKSRDELAEAMEANPHVCQYLLGKTRLPRNLPDHIGFGDRNEAIHYAASFGKAWRKHPRALEWVEATEEPETIDVEGMRSGNGENGVVAGQPIHDGAGLFSDIVVEDEEYTEPSNEEWSALYQAAISFKEQAPWRWMDDTDIFAVENPTDGETGYCVVMGSGGREFGLAVFVGEEGFEHYRRLESGEVEPESFEAASMLRSMSVTYGSRGDLEKEDLASIRSLGLRFRGKNAWPLPRSQRPGWVPWFLNQEEARFLTVVLEQAQDLSARVRDEELELQNEEDEDLILTWYCREATWREEWRKPRMWEPEITVPEPPDPQRLSELRQLAGKPSGTWEMDVFPLPVPVPAESGRLYFPHLALVVDRSSGMVLSVDVLGPAPRPVVKQELVVRLLERAHHIPRNLRVATEDMRRIIEPLARMLGMSVRVGVLPVLEEAKHGLQESLMDGDF
jgi:tetratricopeptide (TPR) repeat protein